jgi:hypothetical protein
VVSKIAKHSKNTKEGKYIFITFYFTISFVMSILHNHLFSALNITSRISSSKSVTTLRKSLEKKEEIIDINDDELSYGFVYTFAFVIVKMLNIKIYSSHFSKREKANPGSRQSIRKNPQTSLGPTGVHQDSRITTRFSSFR